MRSLIRAASLLLFSARVFAIEPVIGTETPIASQPGGTSASLTSSPAAAASPTGYYVAWFDSAHPVGDPRLVGMRVSRAGEALDGFGITLAAHASAGDLKVSWNGNDYAVVSGAQHWLISPAGDVRGPFGNPPPGLTVRSARGETVIVESLGSTKLTYIDNGIRTDSVTLSGSALTIHVVLPVENDWVVLASDQAGTAGTIRWFRVNRQSVIASNVINANPLQRSIAASPSDIVITWTTRRALSANQDLVDLGQTIVDLRSGAFRDEILESNTVSTGASPYRTAPFVFFDGNAFVYVTTHLENDQYIIRTKSAGVVRTAATSDSRHPLSAAVVGSGAGNLLVWQIAQPRSDRSGSTLLSRAFERVFEFDQARTPVTLSRAPATQVQPRAAVGAAGMFTAWREVSDTGRIVGRFFPTLGAASARIDLSGTSGDTDALAVAANVDTYLVAWRELDLLALSNGAFVPLRLRIKVRRFDANGVSLDPTPILIVDHTAVAEGFGDSGVSAVDDGATFVIAWSGEFGKLHLARIPSRGPVFAGVRILDEQPEAGPVLLRPNNGGLTLFWTTTSLKGALLRTNLVPETPLTLVDEEDVLFDVAAKDDELLIAWSSSSGCLRSRRFTLALNAIEPSRVLVCDGTPYLPATTWDGTRWWVAAAGTNAEQPLRGWRLFLDGAPEPPVTILAREQRALHPELVRTPAGLSALYARLDEASSFTWHAFLRPIIVKSRGRAVRH